VGLLLIWILARQDNNKKGFRRIQKNMRYGFVGFFYEIKGLLMYVFVPV
jgi:hypothetical protein